jgi:predicted DCC family thiol-disulfide oxidoreductase YuxK
MNDTKAIPECTGARPPEPLVLFDGGCPMCRREIAHYRRLEGSDRLAWIDIARTPDIKQRFGVSHADAMARLHVRDAAGHWQVGAHGFVEIWGHLRGYRWLGRAIRVLHLTSLLDHAYHRFARWRLKRRCDGDACVETSRMASDCPAMNRRAT